MKIITKSSIVIIYDLTAAYNDDDVTYLHFASGTTIGIKDPELLPALLSAFAARVVNKPIDDSSDV